MLYTTSSHSYPAFWSVQIHSDLSKFISEHVPRPLIGFGLMVFWCAKCCPKLSSMMETDGKFVRRYFETCMLTSGMQESQDWENCDELWELNSDMSHCLSAKLYRCFMVMQTLQIPYKRWSFVNNTPIIWNIRRPMFSVPFWNSFLFRDTQDGSTTKSCVLILKGEFELKLQPSILEHCLKKTHLALVQTYAQRDQHVTLTTCRLMFWMISRIV